MKNTVIAEILEPIEEKCEEAIAITETISSFSVEESIKALAAIRGSNSPRGDMVRIVNIDAARSLLRYMDQYLTDLKCKTKKAATNVDNTDLTRFMTSIATLHDNSDPSAKKKAEEILKSYSTSGMYRLRYPQHLENARQFISDLMTGDDLNQFRKIFEQAPDVKKFRVYDLANAPASELNPIAAQFAIKQKPQTLDEFVEYYEFFKAWCLPLIDNIKEELKQKNLSRDEKKQQLKKRLDQSQMVDQCQNDLHNYREAARLLGVGPIDCAVQLDGQGLRTLGAQLKFKSDSALAYHVLKHYKEIPDTYQLTLSLDNIKSKVREELHDILTKTARYLEAARAVIHTGEFTVYPDQFEGDVFKFECEKINLKAFIKLFDGKAFIATCMTLKI